jgi:porin
MFNILLQKSRFLRWIGTVMLAGAMVTTQVYSDDASSGNNEESELNLSLGINNPGSIVERLEVDAAPKEYLFQFPGLSGALKPWYDLKKNLDKKYGFKFGISYTAFYQKTNDNFRQEDDAASYDLDISGTWTFFGNNTDSPTMLGFDILKRDTFGSKLPPQRLFTQYGGLYSGAAPFGEEDLAIGELYIQKIFKKIFGFRFGQIFPITAYDFFPFKNFRTDFTDFNHVTNSAIPLPGNGLGAFVVYRPKPRLMLRLGAHDANADLQKSGFDTYDGELFKIFEVGYDTGLLPRIPGGPPQGHVHVSIWHQDERDDEEIDDGWGIATSAVQRFDRFSPFVRYGYSNAGADGPTSVKHMANLGLVIDNIFGQNKDRIGIGYTWSHPADSSLNNEDMIDAYYRIQLTPEIQIGPTLDVIFDPVNNPDEDTAIVWGFRARMAL